MLYEGYELTKDAFYESDTDYSLAIQFLEYASNPEYIKQRILCSNCRSFFGREASPKECIAYLLLCVPFLTMEHIVTLKLYATHGAARVFLNRIEKNKYAPFRTSKAGSLSREKIVYLSTDLYNSTFNSLPTPFTSRRHITPNAKTPSLGSFGHDTSVINLICNLLSDRNFNFFEFWWRAPINIYSSFDTSIEEYMENSSLNVNTDMFIPDGIVKSLENRCITFIEQDMSTERLNQLETKFLSYIKFMDQQSLDELNLYNILVSVDSKYSTNINQSSIPNSNIVMERNLKDAHTLQVLSASYHTESLDELVSILDTLIKNNKGKLESIRNFTKLRTLICTSRTIAKLKTVDELACFLNSTKSSLSAKRDAAILSERRKWVQSRVNTFRHLADKNQDLQQHFLHGLTLYVIDSHDFDCLPYLLIQQYRTYDMLMEFIMARHIKFNFRYQYEPYITHQVNEKSFVFKNVVQYSTSTRDFLISFENLSIDVSALYRIRNYLSHSEYEESQVFYYLFIDSEKEALDFYSKYISNVRINENIHIAFILLRGVKLIDNDSSLALFTITDGAIEYY